MKCSLPIIVASPATVALQLFAGCWSVLMNSAPAFRQTLQVVAGENVHALGGALDVPAARAPRPVLGEQLRFQPLGGVNGVGAASEVGSKSTAF